MTTQWINEWSSFQEASIYKENKYLKPTTVTMKNDTVE